jgi:hypothetical protein
MNKLTIFFIGATVLVIGIIGTLLGYKYFERQQEEAPLEEIQQEESLAKDDGAVISEKPEIDDTPELPDPEPVDETDSPLIAILASIDLEMILDAGFKDGDLSIEQFDGLIFDDYDISEYQDDEHIKYVIKEGIEHGGSINELIYPSEEIAQGVYGQLKAKMSDEESTYEVNETNQYGKASFFANNSEETNSVFLVVKFSERLYTLHYPAKNHNKMKNILQSL